MVTVKAHHTHAGLIQRLRMGGATSPIYGVRRDISYSIMDNIGAVRNAVCTIYGRAALLLVIAQVTFHHAVDSL
jgi:hypothetical protein